MSMAGEELDSNLRSGIGEAGAACTFRRRFCSHVVTLETKRIEAKNLLRRCESATLGMGKWAEWAQPSGPTLLGRPGRSTFSESPIFLLSHGQGCEGSEKPVPFLYSHAVQSRWSRRRLP